MAFAMGMRVPADFDCGVVVAYSSDRETGDRAGPSDRGQSRQIRDR